MNKKVGLNITANKAVCGYERKAGFEGVSLLKDESYLRFYKDGKEVAYEQFLLYSKSATKIIETFNKYISSDNFCEEPSYKVNLTLVNLDFIKEDQCFRLKGGPLFNVA